VKKADETAKDEEGADGELRACRRYERDCFGGSVTSREREACVSVG